MNSLRSSTGTRFEAISIWWTTFALTWWLNEPYLMQLNYGQKHFQWLRVTDRQQEEADKEDIAVYGPIADMLLALCRWKSAFVCILVLPMHMQTQQSQPQTVDKFLDPNRLCRASYRQHMILTNNRIHFKRSQNQHIQGSAQTTSERIQLTSQEEHPKGNLHRHLILLRQILLDVVSSSTAVCTLWLKQSLTVSHPEGETHA